MFYFQRVARILAMPARRQAQGIVESGNPYQLTGTLTRIHLAWPETTIQGTWTATSSLAETGWRPSKHTKFTSSWAVALSRFGHTATHGKMLGKMPKIIWEIPFKCLSFSFCLRANIFVLRLSLHASRAKVKVIFKC